MLNTYGIFFIQKQINGIFYVRYFVLFFSLHLSDYLIDDMKCIQIQTVFFFYPKADKCHFLSWVFLIVFPPFLYLINKMKCIQISIQSRMNSLWYEKCYQSTSKQKSCEKGCSFFMLSRHNAFWNGGKKSMKVRRRGDTEECFYPWNGAACELVCIHSENKTLWNAF